MDQSEKVWVPPTKPGEEKWVWACFRPEWTKFPTKLGRWVRVCPNGALEEFHWDPDHTTGKPSRWSHKNCGGDRWERPFDKDAYGNEWRDDRWWKPTDDGSKAVNIEQASEYLAYCTKEGPSLAHLVAEALDLSAGHFEVSVPYVMESDGGWNTAGYPEEGEDYREAPVHLLSDYLKEPASCAVVFGPSIPTEIAHRYSDPRGILQNFQRPFEDRTEQHWTLFGPEKDLETIRHVVRFTSSFLFEIGLALNVDLREFSNDQGRMGQQLPGFIADHVAAFYVHGPSYDGYLIWRRA